MADNYASTPIASDNNPTFTTDAMGTPSLTSPGGHGVKPHTSSVNPLQTLAEAANRFNANVAGDRAAATPTQPANVRFTPSAVSKKG